MIMPVAEGIKTRRHRKNDFDDIDNLGKTLCLAPKNLHLNAFYHIKRHNIDVLNTNHELDCQKFPSFYVLYHVYIVSIDSAVLVSTLPCNWLLSS
jgi:hypothetical protein